MKGKIDKKKMHMIRSVFVVLSLINVLIISYLLFPSPLRRQVFPLIAVLAFASLFIGIALNAMTIKYRVKGALGIFLATTLRIFVSSFIKFCWV